MEVVARMQPVNIALKVVITEEMEVKTESSGVSTDPEQTSPRSLLPRRNSKPCLTTLMSCSRR
jgi:hypothetical protein